MKFPMFGAGLLIAASCMATASAASALEDVKKETVWTAQLKGISG